MKLESLLSQKKSAILEKWFQLIVETYPADTSRFLKREKDRFANPVGQTILQGIEALYEGLLRGADPKEASPFLDQIVRIRAIQNFSPSEAVAFIFDLKKVIRKELDAEIRGKRISTEEMLSFESRVDALANLSFDIFMECREKVYELTANQLKNRTFRLLERSNLISEIPEREPDLKDGDNVT